MRTYGTIFDEPQWLLRRDYEECDWLGVTNDLNVTGQDSLYIQIPTDFYHYIYECWKNVDLKSISFFLDNHDKRWYFGFTAEENGTPIRVDLWYYTESTLPKFLTRVL